MAGSTFLSFCAIALICILSTIALPAQEIPPLRHFTPSDYHGQSQNWAVAQSDAGWIYLANNSGLIEFDGSRSETYTLPDNQTLRCVAVAPNGAIFGGGMAEFGYWQPTETGQLKYTSLSKPLLDEHLRSDEIWQVLILPKGVLFQSFSRLYYFDYQKVVIIRPPGNIMFAQWLGGRVVLPVIGQGLYELRDDGQFRFLAATEVLAHVSVQFLVAGPQGSIWAGTDNEGIFEVGAAGGCKPIDHPLQPQFKQYQLNKAVALRGGGWAIGTIRNGVYVLHPDGGLRTHIHRENGLQNNTILAMAEDQTGQLWLGLDRGADAVALGNPLSVFVDPTGRIGTVYAAAAFEGNLYIGTNHGVFAKKYAKKTAFSSEKFSIVEGTQGQVWHLEVFDNELVVGHNSGSFAIKNRTARRISHTTGGWCTIRVPGHPDALLQSTYSDLVVLRRNAAGQWAFGNTVTGFGRPLKKITFDEQGQLWGQHATRGFVRLELDSELRRVVALQELPDGTAEAAAHLGPERVQGLQSTLFVPDSSGVWIQDAHRTHYDIALVPAHERVVAIDGQLLFCQEDGYAILHQDTHQRTARPVPPVVLRRIETSQGQALPLSDGLQVAWGQNSLRIAFAQAYYERRPNFSWKLEGLSEKWSAWQPDAVQVFYQLPAGNYTLHIRSDVGGAPVVLHFVVERPWYRSGWAYLAYAALLGVFFFFFEKYNRHRLERQRQKLEAEKARELAIQRAEAEKELLLLEVTNKNRDLSNAAFNLIRKNEALLALKDELLQTAKGTPALDKVIRHIDQHLEGDHDWELFEASFNQVHNDFFKRLLQQCPDLTPGDLRLAAYLKMNLSSKEIAPLFNIGVRGVENKRYRLRKKLGLAEEENLVEYLIGF
jgi:ligand-binding sensor domain-containing protein/DNA-binding CsgD family transcriptional regulator